MTSWLRRAWHTIQDERELRYTRNHDISADFVARLRNIGAEESTIKFTERYVWRPKGER